MLGQDTEEPLDRAKESAVNHDGRLAGTVSSLVFEIEALGEGEIELNGRHLPTAANRIGRLHGDFRPIKSGAAGIGNEGQPRLLRHRGERGGGALPQLIGTNKLVRFVIARRELEIEVGKAKITEQSQDKIQKTRQLAFEVFGSNENMSVIHREPADSGEPVNHATFFVAIDRAKLKQPQRQFSIRTLPGAINQNVERAIHRFEVIVDTLFGNCARGISLFIHLDGREHSVFVPGKVSRGFKQFTLGDVRAIDKLIPCSLVLGA